MITIKPNANEYLDTFPSNYDSSTVVAAMRVMVDKCQSLF